MNKDCLFYCFYNFSVNKDCLFYCLYNFSVNKDCLFYCLYSFKRYSHLILHYSLTLDIFYTQVLKMLFLVVIIFILCWLPILCYNVAIAVRAVDPYKVLLYPYARSLNTAFSLLAYCNSCLNPIVYGFMSRYFRKSFKQVRIRKHIPYLMYPVTVRVIHSW